MEIHCMSVLFNTSWETLEANWNPDLEKFYFRCSRATSYDAQVSHEADSAEIDKTLSDLISFKIVFDKISSVGFVMYFCSSLVLWYIRALSKIFRGKTLYTKVYCETKHISAGALYAVNA